MALLKVFGQEGHGIFCLPTLIENELIHSLQVSVLGRETSIQNSFYAISIERKIKNPAAAFLVKTARHQLFTASV